MAVVRESSKTSQDSDEISKTSTVKVDEIDSKSPPISPKNSNTRELLKKACEAANQKFTQTINKIPIDVPTEHKIVLIGKESPSWHGALIRKKLSRPVSAIVKPKNIHPATIKNNSSSPSSKSLFEFFTEIRQEYEDFREIEVSRLKRRLEKLSDFPNDSIVSFEEFEKKIVPWQSDSSTNCCYLCMNEFSLLNRRHHCRLCGRIVCGDMGCLENIPIKLINDAKDLKSCSKCFKTLFRRKIENRLNSNEKRMQSIFKVLQKIKSLKDQLLETIPKFNEYLLEESVTVARPLKDWHRDAWALRDTLILYSVHFRSLMQELAELCETEALDKPIFRVMANNLKRAANEFVQKHMFTLQIINFDQGNVGKLEEEMSPNPKFIKYQSPQWKKMIPSLINELFTLNSSLESGFLEFYTSEGDLMPLDDPSVLKETLRNQEIILNEQLNQLNSELSRTRKSGEDYSSIEASIKDIKRELDRLIKLK